MGINTIITNKKANFEYSILDKETVGVKLMGSELKSLRASKVSFEQSFVHIDINTNTVLIKNMYIKNSLNNAYSHGEIRDRVLLMTKHQIKKWSKEISLKGNTVIPMRGFFDENNRFKLELGLAKGKKLYDKRADIKEKDIKRNNEREWQ